MPGPKLGRVFLILCLVAALVAALGCRSARTTTSVPSPTPVATAVPPVPTVVATPTPLPPVATPTPAKSTPTAPPPPTAPVATATPTPPPPTTPTPTPVPAAPSGLVVTAPVDETVTTASPISVKGSAPIDAIVSVNGKVVALQNDGSFAVTVDLLEGPNLVEVTASDYQGNTVSKVITVMYLP